MAFFMILFVVTYFNCVWQFSLNSITCLCLNGSILYMLKINHPSGELYFALSTRMYGITRNSMAQSVRALANLTDQGVFNQGCRCKFKSSSC